MKTITYLSVLLLGITLFTFSCKKNKDEVNDFSLKEESFDITIKGSNPNGSIDSKIAFESNDSGHGGDRIKLTGLKSNPTSLTIVINLPANSTASGKKESIGLVVTDLDTTEPVWTKMDQYYTFPFTIMGQKKKRAIIDYIIDQGGNEAFYYGSLTTFAAGSVILKRVNNRLIGEFSATLYSDFGNDKAVVSGNFEANLSEDDLE